MLSILKAPLRRGFLLVLTRCGRTWVSLALAGGDKELFILESRNIKKRAFSIIYTCSFDGISEQLLEKIFSDNYRECFL